MKRETVAICFGILAVLACIIVLGVRSLTGLQNRLEDSDRIIKRITAEANTATTALTEATAANQLLRGNLEGIRTERDHLAKSLGAIRGAVSLFRESVDAGADIIDESIALVEYVIGLLEAIESSYDHVE